jgi:WD40 repeat protein
MPTRLREIRTLLRWATYADVVSALAWSPDGRLLATTGSDGRIALWSIGTSSPPALVRTDSMGQGSLLALAWSPDGKLLASGGRATRVLTTRTSDGYRVGAWEGHASYITCLAWSLDGKLVASVGWEGVVRLWRASDGYLVAVLAGHTQSVNMLSWSPDSRQVASGSDGMLQIWDVERQQTAHVLRGPPRSRPAITWAAAGAVAAFGGHGGQIQIHALGDTVTEIAPVSPEAIRSLAWSPDGQILATPHADRMIRLWQRNSGARLDLPQPLSAPISTLVWHPGGRVLAGAGEDRSVQVWELVYS